MDFVFMDSEIDFSTYTLDELYSSARAIDRETYPDRAKEIDDLPTLTLSGGLLGYGILSTLVLHGYLMYQRGQTIGKSLMSIRIANLDGTQASFTTIYFKRMLSMQLLSLVPSVGQFIAGFINPLFIFGKDKRCLHDHFAGTKVSYVD